jgi:hypothetical protein
MTREEFTRRLDDIALLMVDGKFPGVRWMTEVAGPIWNGSIDQEWAEMYHPLIRMLFNLGVIGCAKLVSTPVMYVHDDPDYMEQVSNVETATLFFIHPTYRAALDVQVVKAPSAANP